MVKQNYSDHDYDHDRICENACTYATHRHHHYAIIPVHMPKYPLNFKSFEEEKKKKPTSVVKLNKIGDFSNDIKCKRNIFMIVF